MQDAIKVLLVEDNPADADLTVETFEVSKLKIDLSIAVDGVEALAFLRDKSRYAIPGMQPDLILLDLNLPRKGGHELLADLKADDGLRHLPVVILTSSEAEQDIVATYAKGANCYVTKPVDLVAFQKIVQAIEDFWFTVVRLPTR
ncbi:response regulator [Jiella endophytica]|uniref:Response regulator n=1 Tax=Jiella endophytica TaxID=2558362 RepID=A0A4Y8R9G2_9HYPH|nr:response regulator [Jiella endophytica]TFF18041.1 response regulator [Jiella endophytica]